MIVNKYNTGGGGSGSGYTLPIASASRLGGIKVGDGLNIDPITGILSTSGNSEGGDSHILLASNAAPAGIQNGDVWAEYTPAAGPVFNDDFVSTGDNNITYNRYGSDNPQAIRLSLADLGDTTFNFRWADADWDDGRIFTISNGEMSYDTDNWSGTTTHADMISPAWIAKTGGIPVLHADIVNGYLYFYTDDPSVLWIYGVTDNSTSAEVEEGTVTPGHADIYNVYQLESGVSKQMAKAEDLPEASRLLPESANETEMLVWGTGEWRLQNRAAVVFDGLVATGNYTEQLGKHQTLNRSSQWGMEWRPTVAKSIHAVSRQYAAFEADDNMQEAGILTSRPDSQGNVNLYYATSETGWDNSNRRWRPADQNYGVNAYSHARYLITTGGQFGFVDDDDANNTVMQIACGGGAIEGIENLTLEHDSEGGYYSGQTPAGNTLLAKDMGQNTFYVCIGTDPATMQYEGTLTPVSLSDGALYVKGIPVNIEEIVPTSPSIARIWSGTQAQYDALGTYDNNTFYIIL